MSDSLPSSEHDCYHCGLPIPADVDLPVEIDGAPHQMCCTGCQAVAQSIVSSGLVDYYKRRDTLPEQAREAMPEELKELGLFDHPDFQKGFVKPIGEHDREADLILEGITCAACIWLNEQHVAQQPGVIAVDINYATRRARVRWDERKIKLSDILGAIQAIGYRAYPYDAARSEQISQRERRSALWRLFVAGFGMMQVMMYAFPVYVADPGDMTADIELLMRWASLILTAPVVLYSAAPFFSHALRDVRLRRLGMDVPVALGVGAAFVASCWATFTGKGEVYFDSVTMFVFFLLCGRYVEMLARQKAVRGVEELGKVIPAFAERLAAYPSLEGERVPVSQLSPGEVIRVKPGETMPVDGVVIEGHSEANEALLTGESRPVAKAPGADVTGGSVNIGSPLVVKVSRTGENTRLAAIRHLMERASAEKPRVVQQADRVAAYFILALLVLSVVTAAWWWWADPDRALWVFVSVLVVSCPCALSLATPVALTVATDSLARMGVLVTRGHAIEALARASHFVFDKTGTLTYGEMRVEQVRLLGNADEMGVLALAAALEQGSEHAIAVALRLRAGAEALPVIGGLAATTGQGVSGSLDGVAYRIGRPTFVADLVGSPVPDVLLKDERSGRTVIALGSAHGWLAGFALSDGLRDDCPAAFDSLRGKGIALSIFSGDTPSTVEELGRRLGVAQAIGAMTPEDKHRGLLALQKGDAVIAMVGDGVNDAPVLAQAQVSVAMGGGTDLARNQADIVLLSGHLASLAEGVTLSRRALTIIRQNLWWSFAYNFSAVPLAMFGLVTPWMAGIGMSASSLFVVLNALRLQRRLPR
ncbi:MAG: heavy metal translocating P-type ATPase [Zoogloea sp.]|uniref:heavy metal translocating P-type ATPase n=1 Tax=Zoogloea sp. TaxID=49181 RepID=UPI00260983F1|nr:heavy metal translocating P-type ATPase [Zoogloea sp.]MDD2987711.1 heavy metal translocating P-type ATPase [Zoogloea sp.]